MIPSINIEKFATLTGHNSSVFCLCPYDSPANFLSAGGDGWIVAWNFNKPDPGRLIAKIDTQIFSLCYLSHKHLIVAGNMNGGVHWIDIRNPENTLNIQNHQKGVFSIINIGNSLFTAGGEGLLTKWDVPQQKRLESFHLSNKSLRCMAYSQKRNELAIGSSDQSIYILNAQTLQIKKRLSDAHNNSVFSIRYTPDDRYLISGGRDAYLRVRDTQNGFDEVSAQPAHWYTINDIVFHPKAPIFATASRDKTIKIWSLESFKLLKVIETVRDQGHLNSVNRLYWSTHNNYLVSCSDDRSIAIWHII